MAAQRLAVLALLVVQQPSQYTHTCIGFRRIYYHYREWAVTITIIELSLLSHRLSIYTCTLAYMLYVVCTCAHVYIFAFVLGSPSLHSLVAHVELLSSSQCSRFWQEVHRNYGYTTADEWVGVLFGMFLVLSSWLGHCLYTVLLSTQYSAWGSKHICPIHCDNVIQPLHTLLCQRTRVC